MLDACMYFFWPDGMMDKTVLDNDASQHPTAGNIRQPRPAARFEKTPAAIAATASIRGADNEAILAELGRTADDITALRAAGIIE